MCSVCVMLCRYMLCMCNVVCINTGLHSPYQSCHRPEAAGCWIVLDVTTSAARGIRNRGHPHRTTLHYWHFTSTQHYMQVVFLRRRVNVNAEDECAQALFTIPHPLALWHWWLRRAPSRRWPLALVPVPSLEVAAPGGREQGASQLMIRHSDE